MSDAYERQIQRRIASEGYAPELVAALFRHQRGEPGVGDGIWVAIELHWSSRRPGRRLTFSEMRFAGLDRNSVWLALAVQVYNEVVGYSHGTQAQRAQFLEILEGSRAQGLDYGDAGMVIGEALSFASNTFFGGRHEYRTEYVRIPSDEDLVPRGSGWRRVP